MNEASIQNKELKYYDLRDFYDLELLLGILIMSNDMRRKTVLYRLDGSEIYCLEEAITALLEDGQLGCDDSATEVEIGH